MTNDKAAAAADNLAALLRGIFDAEHPERIDRAIAKFFRDVCDADAERSEKSNAITVWLDDRKFNVEITDITKG